MLYITIILIFRIYCFPSDEKQKQNNIYIKENVVFCFCVWCYVGYIKQSYNNYTKPNHIENYNEIFMKQKEGCLEEKLFLTSTYFYIIKFNIKIN